MTGQARTWPSLDALRLAFGEVTRVAETEDRRYGQGGRLVLREPGARRGLLGRMATARPAVAGEGDSGGEGEDMLTDDEIKAIEAREMAPALNVASPSAYEVVVATAREILDSGAPGIGGFPDGTWRCPGSRKDDPIVACMLPWLHEAYLYQ